MLWAAIVIALMPLYAMGVGATRREALKGAPEPEGTLRRGDLFIFDCGCVLYAQVGHPRWSPSEARAAWKGGFEMTRTPCDQHHDNSNPLLYRMSLVFPLYWIFWAPVRLIKIVVKYTVVRPYQIGAGTTHQPKGSGRCVT